MAGNSSPVLREKCFGVGSCQKQAARKMEGVSANFRIGSTSADGQGKRFRPKSHHKKSKYSRSEAECGSHV